MFRLARRYFRLWPATRDRAGDYTWDFLSFVCCTLLTLYSFPTLSSHLQTPARSLPCRGPNNLFNNFNLLKIPRQSERGCPGRRGDSLGSQTAESLHCARRGRAWGGRGCFVPGAGSSEGPPWKYPLVLRAVKILSGFQVIITRERSNFGETISSSRKHPH